MADQKVNIKVTAQGAKKTQNELRGVEGAISKMGKAVGIATTAYFGATGLINAFGSAIELAGRQEQAEKALEVALGKTSQSLLNQASALQKVTTFGDEAIISQQAFLASLDFTEDQIKNIIQASVDLSSATGISLESAVRNTAKTFSGLSGELGELIPQLRDLTQEEMKAGKAVEVMAGLFGGTASAQAETLTGKIEQMKNAVGDAGEAIGGLLAPVVIKVASGIATLAGGTGDLIERIKDLADGNTLAGKQFEFLNQNTENFKKEVAELGHREINEMAKNLRDLTSDMMLDNDATTLLNEKFKILNERLKEFGIIKAEISDEEFNDSLNKQIFATGALAKATQDRLKSEMEIGKVKKENIQRDLRGAILSGQSAKQAMASVVRAETMEAVAGLLSSILKTVPYPLNLILGAGAGAVASSMMDNALAGIKAETGYEGVVTKPTLFLTGENNKPEQVSVTPLGGQSASGITVNISAPLVDETVVDSIIPAIERAKSLGTA